MKKQDDLGRKTGAVSARVTRIKDLKKDPRFENLIRFTEEQLKALEVGGIPYDETNCVPYDYRGVLSTDEFDYIIADTNEIYSGLTKTEAVDARKNLRIRLAYIEFMQKVMTEGQFKKAVHKAQRLKTKFRTEQKWIPEDE